MIKTHWSELAIYGGQPAFAEALDVGRPNIGNRDMLLERINDILDRRRLSNDGPYVQAFEYQIASLLGVKHCIAVCNGTIGLELGIRALELQDEVIVPSFTFVATAHALKWLGITPHFCDIAPGTYHLDPKGVVKAITRRTTGILAVHVWGAPCDIEALTDIAKQFNLRLMFDAAHALGCSSNGTMIGNFGDLEVFSFNATKFINSFEGGAITTNSDELAARLRSMRNFGFQGYESVERVGTNAKMSEVSAAMGLTSLESYDAFVDVNRDNYRRYSEHLCGIPGVSVMRYDDRERCNYQYVVLEIDDALTGITRDDLVEALHAENVLARRYFYPGCHRMQPYNSYYPVASNLLSNTEQVVERVMALPTGTGVNTDNIDIISDLVKLMINYGPMVHARISGGASV